MCGSQFTLNASLLADITYYTFDKLHLIRELHASVLIGSISPLENVFVAKASF